MTALAEGDCLGPYRIVRLLGEGGMGAVYEARQEPLERRVALKTLHAEFAGQKDAVARFFNEAKTLSRLEHPSIVQVSDFGSSADGTAYLVMEYLHGQSLGRRLRDFSARGERLPVVTTLQFGFQIADVLAIAHSQGIVHRDIKPDNLMLIADAVAPGGERVKLLDFGIAKLTHEGDKGGVKTATQTVMGTPSYMSPEQCSGAGGVDAKTDVYALGCVLYEVLAGRPPFVAEGAGQLIGMHLFQSPPPLSGLAPKVPDSVVDLVHRLLTKDKLRRPTMSESADEIGKLLSKQTGGGTVVRSRHVGSTDPNGGHTAVVPSPGTTLGRSIGQQITGSSRRSLFLGAAVITLLGGGYFVASRTNALRSAHPMPVSSLPITVAPTIAPALVVPPVPAAPPPAIKQTPDAMPVPQAQPMVAEKPRPAVARPLSQPTVSRPPTRVSVPKTSGASSPPPTKSPPKKQIGYVPL
jgi:serine/threonine-protein kinase